MRMPLRTAIQVSHRVRGCEPSQLFFFRLALTDFGLYLELLCRACLVPQFWRTDFIRKLPAFFVHGIPYTKF